MAYARSFSSDRQLGVFAFVWGLAEATVFFVVPDVLLTLVAATNLRLALFGAASATAGALFGGAFMFYLGATDPTAASALLLRVPLVDGALVADVQRQITQTGLLALFLGPLTGTPYKIYAVSAAIAGHAAVPFLLISIPARAIRFVLLSVVSTLICEGLCHDLTLKGRYRLIIALWIGFYMFYASQRL